MTTTIIQYLCALPTILFSLSFHECAHGFVAYKLGDSTAKDLGRLTLNPIKHLDIFGTLCMLLFHVGWAKPVPINVNHFKNPKRGMALAALAGPLSNLLLSIIGVFGFSLFSNYLFSLLESGAITNIEESWQLPVYLILYDFYYLNIVLFVFNLFPIPPFDGSRILLTFLPTKYYFKVMHYERYFVLGLFGFYIVTDVLYAKTGMDFNFISMFISWLISIMEEGLFAIIGIIPLL